MIRGPVSDYGDHGLYSCTKPDLLAVTEASNIDVDEPSSSETESNASEANSFKVVKIPDIAYNTWVSGSLLSPSCISHFGFQIPCCSILSPYGPR